MIDFILTDKQLGMQSLAREFAEKEIKPYAMEWDSISTGEFDGVNETT